MSRNPGGYLGFSVSPTTATASGVWTLAEASRYRGDGAWPEATGGGGGGGGTAGYTVSGDSIYNANGTFCEAGTFGGKPYYTNGTWFLYWGTELAMSYSGWVISDGDMYDSEMFWYWYSSDSGATPPSTLTGYIGGGMDTLTLTATTCG